MFGDAVHVRFACMDDIEFVGYVIATEATLCMAAMPKQFYACCVAAPRTKSENLAVSAISIFYCYFKYQQSLHPAAKNLSAPDDDEKINPGMKEAFAAYWLIAAEVLPSKLRPSALTCFMPFQCRYRSCPLMHWMLSKPRTSVWSTCGLALTGLACSACMPLCSLLWSAQSSRCCHRTLPQLQNPQRCHSGLNGSASLPT